MFFYVVIRVFKIYTQKESSQYETFISIEDNAHEIVWVQAIILFWY